MLYPIIMAGGVGRRLWPISTGKTPKQVSPFLDGETMLTKTMRRLAHRWRPGELFVATSREVSSVVRRALPQVPASHFSIEPERRETAPALALAVLRLHHHDPKAAFVYINADNFIKNEAEFHRVLRLGEKIIHKHPRRLVIIGVRPTYAEPGLGYIKMGREEKGLGTKKDHAYAIESFVEKPDAARAAEFIASGKYLWNPTLIMARADNMLALYRRHLPVIASCLERIRPVLGTRKERMVIDRTFRKMTRIDINRGILEKEKGMLTIPAEFGWTDVGHWKSVHEALSPHPDHNVTRGEVVTIDSRGNFLFSESGKLIATVGIHDTVLVETKNAILLISKYRAHEVKQVIEEMEKRGLNKYL